ncbi:helix-turn-helix domain-containing protein [Mailhella sp.]|uniref:helix-turn-helix domain-containing protein n=1 Tax=Mailhella sp. TaxID=1981029 RepID=UPI0040649E81
MTRAECARRRYLNRYKIRAILDDHGLSMSELARRIGVTAEAVSATIRGKRHSPKVLDALRSLGVPEKFLNTPCETMNRKAA